MELNNQNLRKKALSIRKNHSKLLIAISIFSMLPAYVSMLNNTFLNINFLSDLIIKFLIDVLIYPIFTLGITYTFLQIWRGNKVRFSTIFVFLFQKKLFNALYLSFSYHLIINIFSLPNQINKLVPNIISPVIFLLFELISILIYIILFLTPYIFCNNPLQKPIALFKDSLRNIKGNIGKFIWFTITTFWWRFAILILSSLTIYLNLNAVQFFNSDNSINLFFACIIGCLIYSITLPYPFLMLAGFSEKLRIHTVDENIEETIVEHEFDESEFNEKDFDEGFFEIVEHGDMEFSNEYHLLSDVNIEKLIENADIPFIVKSNLELYRTIKKLYKNIAFAFDYTSYEGGKSIENNMEINIGEADFILTVKIERTGDEMPFVVKCLLTKQ